MKTKLYIEPGTKLDWDNENHQRHLEEEAYADYDRHPKPTMKPPPRSCCWWFWRFFGMFFYRPARKLLQEYLRHRYVPHDYERNIPSKDVFVWPFAGTVHRWLFEGGPIWGSAAPRLKTFLDWIATPWPHHQCMCCGFTDRDPELRIYDGPSDEQGRIIEMFEHVEGGGVDYWGEGEDAYGWLWCYRCGSVEWDSV